MAGMRPIGQMNLRLAYDMKNYVTSIKTQFYSNRRAQMDHIDMTEIGNGASYVDMEQYELLTIGRETPKERMFRKGKLQEDEIRVEVWNSKGTEIGFLRRARKKTQHLNYVGDEGEPADRIKTYILNTANIKINGFCSADSWTAERIYIHLNIFVDEKCRDQGFKDKLYDNLDEYFTIVDHTEEIKKAYALEMQVRCLKQYRVRFHSGNVLHPFKKLPVVSTVGYSKLQAQPAGVSTKLKPHQVEALYWMRKRENTDQLPLFWTKIEPTLYGDYKALDDFYANKVARIHSTAHPPHTRGGLFCDDMGLGKTLSVISLIVSNDRNRGPIAAASAATTRKKQINWDVSSGSESEDNLLNQSFSQMEVRSKTCEKKPFMSARRPTKKTFSRLATRTDGENESDSESDDGGFAKMMARKALKPMDQPKSRRPIRRMRQKLKFEISETSEELQTLSTKQKRKVVFGTSDSDSSFVPEQPKKRSKKKPLRVIGSTTEESQSSQAKESQSSQTKDQKSSEPSEMFEPIDIMTPLATQSLGSATITVPPGMVDGTRSTLIVVPLAVVSNWEEQCHEHCVDLASPLKIKRLHGEEVKASSQLDLSMYDVVITTYGTLTRIYDNMKKSAVGVLSSVYNLYWLRVVLDEAHVIRNAGTSRCDACLSLQSDRRWFVTGTPMQNRVHDIFTSLKFLKIEPFQHKTYFNEYIGKGFKDEEFERKEESAKNVRALLGNVMMRRTKGTMREDGTPLVELPLKQIFEYRARFAPKEAELYDQLKALCRNDVITRVNRDKLLMGLTKALRKNSFHIFTVLKKLRIMCLGLEVMDETTKKALKSYSSEEFARKVKLEAQAQAEHRWIDLVSKERICSCCEKTLTNTKRSDILFCKAENCGHFFCRGCIDSQRPAITKVKGEAAPHAADRSTSLRVTRADFEEEEESNDIFEEDAAFYEAGMNWDFVCQTCTHGVTIMLDVEEMAETPDDIREQLFELTEAAMQKKIDKVSLEDLKSSKVCALITMINRHFEDEGCGKLVIATQSVQFIYLLHRVIREDPEMADVQSSMFHGAMRPDDKYRLVNQWSKCSMEKAERKEVLLLSITCGGVGINLKAANAIIIVDPSYNPATEAQCIDRVYRLGQEREVKVYKMIMRRSIEEHMVDIQKRKLANIELAIENCEGDEQEQANDKMAALRAVYDFLQKSCTEGDEREVDCDTEVETYNSVDGPIARNTKSSVQIAKERKQRMKQPQNITTSISIKNEHGVEITVNSVQAQPKTEHRSNKIRAKMETIEISSNTASSTNTPLRHPAKKPKKMVVSSDDDAEEFDYSALAQSNQEKPRQVLAPTTPKSDIFNIKVAVPRNRKKFKVGIRLSQE